MKNKSKKCLNRKQQQIVKHVRECNNNKYFNLYLNKQKTKKSQIVNRKLKIKMKKKMLVIF